MQTRAMVIYDVTSAEVRRIIVAEDDAHYAKHHLQTLGPDEAFTFILFDLKGDPQFRSSLEKARAAVRKITGRSPPTP